MDEYINAKEAAEILDCSIEHIRKLCREGAFNSIATKSGPRNSWQIPRIAVEALKEKKR